MLLAHQAQIRRRRHAEQFGGGTDGELLVDDDPKLPLVHREAWATKPLALGAGATQAAFDPFHNERPFESGNRADYHVDGLAEARSRVDLLSQANELDTQVPKQFERLHEMPHGTSEAVEGGDHDDIHMPALDLGHELVERGAPFFRARDAGVDELAHVGPAPRPAVVAEVAKLVVAGLVAGAHTTVQGNAL